MFDGVSPALVGLGLGIALAGAPGPVQAVLLSEAVRGGLARGFKAMAGANLTFGLLLVALALGLSVAHPSTMVLRMLKVLGGGFLVLLAVDGFRSAHEVDQSSDQRKGVHPAARGALAVVLNPGLWLFLGTAASSLFSAATQAGGRGTALWVALALLIGLAVGDGAVVLLGGLGVRQADKHVRLWIGRTLAGALAALGVWFLVEGVSLDD